MAASSSSIFFTLASKLPSSPVLSVYLKWMKKKSYLLQFCCEDVDLLGERLGLADDLHADELGQALVHRIDGDRRGLEAIDLFVARQVRAGRRSRGASGRWPSSRRPAASSRRRSTGWRRRPSSGCRRPAPRRRAAARRRPADRCPSRRPPSPAPRKTTTKRCSFTGSTKISKPGILTSRSRMASGALSSLGMRPARRSLILPAASSVQKLPRAATSPGCMCKADAGRFQRPAADQVLERIVAEQAQDAPARCRARCRERRECCRLARRAWPGRRGSASWPFPAPSCRPASSASRPGRRRRA